MAVTMPGSLLRSIRRLVGVEINDTPDSDLLRLFIKHKDELAFETLVHRHGPLVRGVCMRILGNSTDADDAFQATFLVLARNASTIRKLHSVGPWLHGVAQRIAHKARVQAVRRREHEKNAAALQQSQCADDMTLGELKQILDEELASLPEKYKAPLILCCLQGKSRDEAAQALGWSAGSLKGRLERAREMLRSQLAARGLTLSAALLTLTLLESPAAAVPASLATATVAAGLRFALGQALTGLVSTQVVTLARQAAPTLILSKLKMVAFSCVLMLGFGTASYQTQTTATTAQEVVSAAPVALVHAAPIREQQSLPPLKVDSTPPPAVEPTPPAAQPMPAGADAKANAKSTSKSKSARVNASSFSTKQRSLLSVFAVPPIPTAINVALEARKNKQAPAPKAPE